MFCFELTASDWFTLIGPTGRGLFCFVLFSQCLICRSHLQSSFSTSHSIPDPSLQDPSCHPALWELIQWLRCTLFSKAVSAAAVTKETWALFAPCLGSNTPLESLWTGDDSGKQKTKTNFTSYKANLLELHLPQHKAKAKMLCVEC